MTAYMIFIREGKIHNPAEMEAYRNANREGLDQFKIKPLAVYGEMEVMEGEAPDGVVILEFPNAEEARKWYYSDAYQAAAEHRKKAADYRAFLVEGF